jgi:two-component system, NarL family, response regulator LiaR
MPLTVLIADDSILIRERLAALIAEMDGVHLVGQAETGAEAIALARQHQPDVVILDVCMPGGNGIEALQTIKKVTASQVIMVTAYPHPQYRKKCLHLGAEYFLNKDDEFDCIVPIMNRMQAARKNA